MKITKSNIETITGLTLKDTDLPCILSEIVTYCNDFFIMRNNYSIDYVYDDKEIVFSGSKITYDKTIPVEQYDWIKIYGSKYNDGMYQIMSISNNEITLNDTVRSETTRCNIYLLSFPVEFLNMISTTIKNYSQNRVKSESIGDYSVSFESGEVKKQFDRYRSLYNCFNLLVGED